MSRTQSGEECQVYKIECESGRRYIVYQASAIGDPADHTPSKWYAQLYPVPPGLKVKSAGTTQPTKRSAPPQDARLDETLFGSLRSNGRRMDFPPMKRENEPRDACANGPSEV